MKESTLEVLLVSAKGLTHTNLIGKPSYFVSIECGTQVQKSKTSTEFSGATKHEEIYWNQKFSFDFPIEWVNMPHLKLRIMDEEYFTDGGLVGETTVNLKGIMEEYEREGVIELRPTPYNVVLEDDTYKGQIKIGLKFFPNKASKTGRKEFVAKEKEAGPIFKRIMKLWNLSWSIYRNTNSDDKQKDY